MKKGSAFWNSKTISFVSGLSFFFVICIILMSYSYMNSCVEYESKVQNHRYELNKLGESLADASDYLTDEAREYAITGDIAHLYNYWYEIEQTKTRDRVIEKLTGYHLPEQEKERLEEAKSFSDQLITIETYSMKMILLSQNKSESDFEYNDEIKEYISNVMACELPEGYSEFTPEKMKGKAVEILYDNNYINSKHRIMSPINEFQDIINQRLNSEVQVSVQGQRHALILQIVCFAIAILLMGFILLSFQYFYISPLKGYTNQLQAEQSDGRKTEVSEIRIQPGGAYELREFGRIFNELSCLLFQEVEKSAKAEKRMRIAKEEAVKASHAKSDFLARMSHELRTPLNAITGYVYLLNETDLDYKQQRYCDSIQASSDSLLGLISDVLDFSKIESGNMVVDNTPFSPMDLIEDIYHIMENTAKQKGICLKLDIRSDMPAVVIGDALKLRQVLMNLVGNAIKFTEEGTVTVCAEVEKADEDIINIKFTVEDTGIGIKESEQDTIFQPFIQSEAGTTRKYGGTGLGLAISKKIVEHCSKGKETLQLESKTGKGSKFFFSMPFVTGSRDQLIEEREEPEWGKNSDKVVLLVDDNKINIDVESEIISGFGVRVVTAASGIEAIEYIKGHKADLIFMDIRMPDMDGYESSCKIRRLKNGKKVPIIALSADAVEGVREKVLSFGMNDYITKPLKPVKLKKIMQQYFQSEKEEKVMDHAENEVYFQREECLENLNRNEHLLVTLCNRFLEGQCNTAKFIGQHLKDHNIGNVLYMLHDLKGICGNLCFGPLFDAVSEMENRLQDGKEADYVSFEMIFDATILEVTDFINEKEWYYKENASQEPFNQIYNRFLYLCHQYDVMAVELFQRNIQEFAKHLPKPLFKQLEENILKYDFESAIQLLEKE